MKKATITQVQAEPIAQGGNMAIAYNNAQGLLIIDWLGLQQQERKKILAYNDKDGILKVQRKYWE